MAIGCSLVSSLSDVHGSNADRQRMGHLTDMIDGSLAQDSDEDQGQPLWHRRRNVLPSP